MISLISGGHYAKKGYCYNLYMTFPELSSSKTVNMMGNPHKSIKLSFPTKFMLTTNNIYFNIVLRVLGFGIGLEIQSKT